MFPNQNLILVCFQSIQDAQIAEWATRAFLLYGGSPTATVLPAAAAAGAPPGYHPSQLTSFHEQASFHPGIASTPGRLVDFAKLSGFAKVRKCGGQPPRKRETLRNLK